MKDKMEKYILASASPRRRELLSQIGIDFDIVITDADESKIDKSLPLNLYVQELAILKATAAAEMLNVQGEKHCLIISADTIVSCDGKILGKPSDEEDAFSMLNILSGREHEVYTGICVMRLDDMFTVANYEKTKVYFKKLTTEMIKNYVMTKEPMDKAGAYGIQGKGALLVDKIEGDYFNVVGLPIAKLATLLENEFDKKIL